MALTEAVPTASVSRGRALRDLTPTLMLALAALICAAPAATILISAAGLAASGSALGDPLLGEAVVNTVMLVVLGAGAATVIGALSAWLVSACRFPGRSVFAWMLVLPLAAPAYVLAYAYGAFTGPLGPAPIGLSGNGGALFVYAIAFYPYVYLAARAAFAMQSVCALEAARSLGASPWRAFWRVTAPMAWPAIAAGAALAAMEIAADYGAASYFGAQTLSTAVFRAWNGHANPGLAVQIAAVLLLGAGALLVLERRLRSSRRFAGGSSRWRATPVWRLTGLKAIAACLFCLTVVVAGVVLPAGWLIRLAMFAPENQIADLLAPLSATLTLAAGGGLATLALAWVIAAGSRRLFGATAASAASMGYAAPGAVMALGGLMAAGAAREAGLIGGVGAALSIAMLLWIYAARFAAAGIGPITAGLHAVTPNHVAAARTLGAGRLRRLISVEAPIAAPGLITAGLIIFVEILKELPATWILRPFDFDTLAVVAHAYAADDRLHAAAAPALMIVAVGVVPVIVLMTRLSRSRAGSP